MLFSPRVRNRDLAEMCRRVALAIQSGIEVRKIFARESNSYVPPSMRHQLTQISGEVAQGHSLTAAIDSTGKYFPRLFRELVRVGEQTGHLDQVFRHLADHYEHQEQLRREFMSSISWPLIQLGIALALIAVVIWISGMIGGRDLRGQEFDLLGLGLKGTTGVLIFTQIVMFFALAIFFVIQATRRGVFWAKPIQRWSLHVPTLGGALQTLAVSRFAWSLHLTSETGMSIIRAMPLCLQTMQNATYTDQIEPVTEAVRRGDTLTEALSATRVFPPRFLDAVDVGERSGRLPETMELLTRQYQDEARRAIKVLMQVAAWGVTLAVMGFIAFFIFRMFSFYMGQLKAVL